MTPKDNETLARFCGWKLEKRRFGKRTGWRYTLNGVYHGPSGLFGWGFHPTRKDAADHLPGYANSLSPVHYELEPALEKVGISNEYAQALWAHLVRLRHCGMCLYDILHASAEHRAEAALVVIKLFNRKQQLNRKQRKNKLA